MLYLLDRYRAQPRDAALHVEGDTGVTRRAVVTGGCAAVACILGLKPGEAHIGHADRIVSVGGSLTEIAFALGAGDRIVGVDTTSTWPPETAGIEKVGYMRRLSAEGVLSLNPDLVLLAAGAGPPTAIAQLRSAGVRLGIAPKVKGLPSVVPKIRFVGTALDRTAEAGALVARFEGNMAAVEKSLAPIEARPRVLLLMSVGRGAPLAAGMNTAAAAMIDLAHGRNAMAQLTGYKPVSAEAVIGAAPDVLLLPRHVAEAAGGPERVLDRPDLAQTPAGRDGRVVVMDSLKLLGFGPRTPEAVAELARALHPAHASKIVL
ncbi:MAG: ABC transporter substrate-binding protein [Pseudomonadota bacterium]